MEIFRHAKFRTKRPEWHFNFFWQGGGGGGGGRIGYAMAFRPKGERRYFVISAEGDFHTFEEGPVGFPIGR